MNSIGQEKGPYIAVIDFGIKGRLLKTSLLKGKGESACRTGKRRGT